jgi:hypothetical protein
MTHLLFVYNADSGRWNAYMDMAHKIFSPATYPCSLCDLTYGVFKIRPEWDDFVKNSPLPMVFLHRDEFQEQYPAWKQWPLPAVFRADGQGELTGLISAAELQRFQSIASLESAILKQIGI